MKKSYMSKFKYIRLCNI